MRRRDFLKTSALAAGVSLLEGCGRDEEQFLVQVARRPGALQGETLWRHSVCAQCAAGCGIRVRVVDGDAKKIEGADGHPVNRGGVCALGHSVLQELYNPDRFLTPQRRIGARGGLELEALSWEEALGDAVEALAATAPERVAFVGSDRSGTVGALLRRFAQALGAPAPTFVEPFDLTVERVAARIALGVDDVPYFDVARSDFVLSIGAAMLDRWRSPVHYTGALAEKRRGRLGRRGRLVQAEARMSLTAANADVWVPLRPGSEEAFARAVAGVLLSEGVAGAQARARYRILFPEPEPSVEEAARLCGVSAESIRSVALELAAAESGLVLAGGSAAGHAGGVRAVVAGLGLNLLVDGLGRPGGVYAPVRFGVAAGLASPPQADTPLPELASRMGGGGSDPVELLFVADVDLLHRVPASWGLERALADVGTVIALTGFADETALHADLVLPLSTELERFNAVEPATSVGTRVLSVTEPVVDPLGESHHPGDVLLALATALGPPISDRFPWTSFAALVRERLEEAGPALADEADADPRQAYFDALARGGIFEGGLPRSRPPGPSGPAPSPVDGSTPPGVDGSTPSDGDAFPFRLLPFESVKTGHGRGANRPWLQELPDPLSTVMWNGWLEMAPSDAEALGLSDGDRVRVESESAAVETHVVLDPAARPGVLGMPVGYGFREYGRYARRRGANVLDLLGPARVEGAPVPAFAAARVRVERLGPGGLARFGRGYAGTGSAGPIPGADGLRGFGRGAP